MLALVDFSELLRGLAAADFDQFINDLVAGAAQNGVTGDIVTKHIGSLGNSLRSTVVQK